MGSGNCIPLSRPPEYSEAGGARWTSSISADFDSTHQSPLISVIPEFRDLSLSLLIPHRKRVVLLIFVYSYTSGARSHSELIISCPAWKSPPLMLLGLRSEEMDRTYLLGTTCSPRHWSLTSQWPGEDFSVRVAVNDPETYQTVTQQISLVALRIELIHSKSSKQVPLLDVLLNISSITSYLGPPKKAQNADVAYTFLWQDRENVRCISPKNLPPSLFFVYP